MLPEPIKNYRDLVTLKDGVSVLLRLLTKDDEGRLLDLFGAVSDADLRYLRNNVRDKTLVKSWCQDLDHSQVLHLTAVVNERAVGHAMLCFLTGPERHMSEVLIYLAKDFRQRGLGTKMIKALIAIARHMGLHLLMARVVADQSRVIKSFQDLGFSLSCTFDDAFMLPDGELRDVAVLFYRLKSSVDEF